MTRTLELADGRRVALESAGAEDRRPLVLLHGFPDSRLTCAALAAPASRAGALLLVPDRPGIGLSTGRLDSLAACAPWLAAVADALGLDRFPLVGVSGGGPFALACARLLPDRVERAVVVSGLGPPELGTAGMPAGQRLGIAVARRAPGPAAAVLAATAALARRRPDLFLALVRAQSSGADARVARGPEAVAGIARPYAEAFRQGSAGVRQELRLLLSPWGFRPEEIALPVHFEHGTADATVPPAAARALCRLVPFADLALHEGLGHFSLVAARAEAIVELALHGRR